MVYMSNKMERQLNRKGNGCPIQVEYGCRYKSYEDKKDIYMDNRGKSKTQTLYNHDKKMFFVVWEYIALLHNVQISELWL